MIINIIDAYIVYIYDNSPKMNSFDRIPLDPIQLLLDFLYKECGVSFAILSYVANFWYKQTGIYIRSIGGTSLYLYGKRNREIVCHEIASKGYSRVLKWAREIGCQWDNSTCNGAARGGHLELLQWVIQEGCTWNNAAGVSAARGGHLQQLGC